MERRTALATSATMLATVAVGAVAFAALGGLDVMGFGGNEQGATPTIVTIVQVTTDGTVVVDAITTTAVPGVPPVPGDTAGVTPVPDSPASGGGGGGGTPVAGPGTTTPRATTPGAPNTTAAPTPTPAPTPAPTSPPTVAPTTPTTAPRVTTPPTTAPPTGTTLPPGVRIPSDWPPGVPIPPIPPGCKQPQLEDNGVWNCQ